MEIAYSDRGGWFAGSESKTGASSCLMNIPKYLLAAGLIASLGTGPSTDDLELLRRLNAEEAILSNPLKGYVVEANVSRTPAEDVQKIREVISPAMSNIAKMLGVSRQTIYNWMNGEFPKDEHVERLHEIAVAADTLSKSGIVLNGLLLKRKLTDGKNLYNLIAEGRSAQDSVQLLMRIAQKEAIQKKLLSSRFAGRTKSSKSADSDIIAENDRVL